MLEQNRVNVCISDSEDLYEYDPRKKAVAVYGDRGSCSPASRCKCNEYVGAVLLHGIVLASWSRARTPYCQLFKTWLGMQRWSNNLQSVWFLAIALGAFLWLAGWQGSEVFCIHKGCPSSYPDLYVVGVKACAPGPQLVLVLWETGREMACELCNNHPKACTGRLGFIDRLLEIEWSNAPEIELTLIPLHDHM